MGEVFKTYFSHWTISVYIFLALGDDLLHTFPKPQEVSNSETVLDLETRFGKETAII
tara:strand:- start:96 stop:266 length:171 start_codon:yes stop_codon:yes gene_type:complete